MADEKKGFWSTVAGAKEQAAGPADGKKGFWSAVADGKQQTAPQGNGGSFWSTVNKAKDKD